MSYNRFTTFYFYPRSPRGERPLARPAGRCPHLISIHAPREGSDGDAKQRENSPASLFLSTLPARGATSWEGWDEADDEFLSTLPARGATRGPGRGRGRDVFLSTLPARGATRYIVVCYSDLRHFYPRSPRGERRRFALGCRQSMTFLSTLPARGATSGYPAVGGHQPEFLSTLPARGATGHGPRPSLVEIISIHAPREGSDPAVP